MYAHMAAAMAATDFYRSKGRQAAKAVTIFQQFQRQQRHPKQQR
jgi:hypothetical protein